MVRFIIFVRTKRGLMTKLMEVLGEQDPPRTVDHRPLFFRLSKPDDRSALEELLARTPHIQIFDALHSQVAELIRSLNPSIKYTKEELREAANARLEGMASEEYGAWVYYPWSGRLVHILDEEEFKQVRTDRNRNKITREEQAILATKKVGVIGLSVGQSVSLTMALERSFGEIRLADHDTLDLSNLNRIRSGVHSLGINKALNVAREIAELDPFLKVTCFTEGITKDTIDRFFNEGGRLDVLVEECDSVDIKIIARQKAKELGIPVVMETSDRGMLDVERFDLEPERPILHGFVDHLDLSLAASARTNEEKMPFVLPIIGLDTMSVRMKASMLEIENSVTTWPQLGSSVTMGGAVGGHVMRRIALGHEIPSGRWWIDPDTLMNAPEQLPSAGAPNKVHASTDHEDMDLNDMIDAASRVSRNISALKISDKDAAILSSAGTHAPSGGNSQPWRFLHHSGRLFLFLDVERAKSALDPGFRYAYLGLGACAENMILQAARSGMRLVPDFHPLRDTPGLVAVLTAEHGKPSESAIDPILADHIASRCTNRRNSDVRVMDDNDARALTESVRDIHGTGVILVRDEKIIDRIARLCGKAERLRFLNATCHHDMFVKEMRWESAEVESSRDGIDIETLELSHVDRIGLRVASDPAAMSMLKYWGVGHAMEKISAKNIRASSALAVITVPDLELETTFAAGRVMERLWLRATSLHMLAHPVSAPIFMGLHGLWDKDGILSAKEHEEARRILIEFSETIEAGERKPFFMLRLGLAEEPTARSLRRPLEDVLFTSDRVPA